MIEDSTPALLCASDAALADGAVANLSAPPPVVYLDTIFSGDGAKGEASAPPYRHADHDAVTIVYTSGTSGEPKGVVLNAGNVTFMLGCTNARLDQLMGQSGDTGPRVSVRAILFRRGADSAAHVAFAQQLSDAFDGPDEACRRPESRGAELFRECAAVSRARSAKGRGVDSEARRSGGGDFCAAPSEPTCGGMAARTLRLRILCVCGSRERLCFPRSGRASGRT